MLRYLFYLKKLKLTMSNPQRIPIRSPSPRRRPSNSGAGRGTPANAAVTTRPYLATDTPGPL